MSSHPEVMRVCNSIDIDSDLINAAKSECEGLDLDATAAFNIFPPGEKCVRIIDCLKKQVCLGLNIAKERRCKSKADRTTDFTKSHWACGLGLSSWCYRPIRGVNLYRGPDQEGGFTCQYDNPDWTECCCKLGRGKSLGSSSRC